MVRITKSGKGKTIERSLKSEYFPPLAGGTVQQVPHTRKGWENEKNWRERDSMYTLERNRFTVYGRATGAGAYTDAVVYTPTGKEINPVRESRSRTGNHWVKEWNNLGDSFVVVYYDRTNSGHDKLEVIVRKSGGEPERMVWRDKKWYKALRAEEIIGSYKEYLSEVDE